MGYNLKATYCDLASVEGTRVAAVSTILRGDSSDQRHNTNFVDLNLGGQFVGEAGLTLTSSGFRFGLEGHKAPLMEPFSGGSSKRARVPSSTSQTVSCLVDGCKSDLSKCRDYHRRHKVCEMHSKTPKVTIGGHEQRFCQQCSRFHSLGEFDEGKRSCRKRLEGHNRRRRKPQPEPLPVNPGNFLSAGQGSRYMSFSNQAMIPASSVVSTTWSGSSSIKPDPNPSLFSTTSVSGSYSQPYRGGRQFPFLQPTDSSLAAPSSTLHQTTHTCSSGGGSDNNGSNNNVNHHLNHGLIDSSDHRALSLLSSSPVETPEMGLGQAIHQPSPINPPRPIISNLLYSSHEHEHEQQFHHNTQGLQQGHHHGGSGSALMRASNSHSLCQDVFQTGTDASSATAAHQTLSFSWE